MKSKIFSCIFLSMMSCSDSNISQGRKVFSSKNTSSHMIHIDAILSTSTSTISSSSSMQEKKEEKKEEKKDDIQVKVFDNAMIKICIENNGGEEACRKKYGSWQTFSPQTDSSLSLATVALLSVIGEAEGTKDRYDIIFSFQTFTSFKDHPRRLICSGGYCSDASGRYQFLSTTWDETKKAISVSDFSPKSQDLGAVYRIETFRGVKNHAQKLSLTQFEAAIYKLNREWASFPGSPYGQPVKTMSDLWKVYVSKF